MSARPIILLDFDEVIVLNRPGDIGRFDVISPNPPPEVWECLFHKPAIQTLAQAITEHQARVVITTRWLRFMLRDAFEHIVNFHSNLTPRGALLDGNQQRTSSNRLGSKYCRKTCMALGRPCRNEVTRACKRLTDGWPPATAASPMSFSTMS